MKKVMLLFVVVCLGLASYAQNDTVAAKQFAERLNQLRKERGMKELTVVYKSTTKKVDYSFYKLLQSMEKIMKKKIYLIENEQSLHDSVRYVLQHTSVFDYSFKFCSFDSTQLNTKEVIFRCENLNLLDTTYNHVVVWSSNGKIYGLFVMKYMVAWYSPMDLISISGFTQSTEVYFKNYQEIISEYDIQKYIPKNEGKLSITKGEFHHYLEDDVKSVIFTDKQGNIVLFYAR